MGLPSGLVTFAFVDVVGSTRLLAAHGAAFVAALERVQAEVAASAQAHTGVVVKTEGDGAFLAFASADAAVRALSELQRAVEAAAGDDEKPEPRLRLRAGAHTGPAQPVAGDYVALAVNVAARVTSAASAGQVLVTPAVVAALEDDDLVAVAGSPVGDYALKDVEGPTPLHRIAGDATPPRAPSYRPTNVALPMTSFLGREEEQVALRDLLASNRMVTVLGAGGMGKTRLASQLALQVAGSYDAGAWLVELASVSEDDQVLSQIAAAVASNATSADELVADLRIRGRLLLVLDNCEHVVDAAAKAAEELVAGVPGLSVLATSREPLQLDTEVVWRIPPLQGEAVRCDLFEERLARAAGRAETVDRAVVGELCALLDGSPLAIELAAVQAREVPLTELVELVRGGEDALPRRGGGRQSSLDAVVEWSVARLAPSSREALLVLSQAPGRLTAPEAALLLAGVVERHGRPAPELLRMLVRSSLVDLDGSDYRLLDTIRTAARRLLRADEQLVPRARAMLHAAAAALIGPVHELSLYRAHDPLASRLQLIEEAVLDAWRDRTPGLGAAWLELGYLATALPPMSDRLAATAEEVLAGAPQAALIAGDDAARVCGALTIVVQRFGQDGVGWDAPRMRRFLHAVIAGSPLPIAVRAAFHVLRYFWRNETLDELREFTTIHSELAARSGLLRSVTDAAYAEGWWWAAVRDFEQALHHSRRAFELATEDYPEREILAANYADCLRELGRYDEALAVVRTALDRGPVLRDRWVLLSAMAHALVSSGSVDEGNAVADEVRAEMSAYPGWRFTHWWLEGLNADIPPVADAS